MGNLRSQNEQKCPPPTPEEYAYQDQEDDPFEEDYIRTQSYFASSSRPSIVNRTIQPSGIPVRKTPGQNVFGRSCPANYDGDSSVDSANVSLPLPDSIIPDTFDTVELAASNGPQETIPSLMGKVLSGSPTMTILSDALSRSSLAEPNIAKVGAAKLVTNVVNIDTQPIAPPVIQAPEVSLSIATSGVQSGDTQADARKVTLELPGSSNSRATTRSLSGRASKSGRLEAASHTHAPPKKTDVTSQPPSRSHSRSRRRRKRRSVRAAASSDVEDGRNTESSVNVKRYSGQTPPLKGTRASSFPSPSLTLTHGLSSSRWAPHSEHSSPTVPNMTSDRTYEAKPDVDDRADVSTGDKNDEYRRSAPPRKNALTALEGRVPTVEIPGAFLQSLKRDYGHEGDNPSFPVPSTQSIDESDQHPHETSTKADLFPTPVTSVDVQVHGLHKLSNINHQKVSADWLSVTVPNMSLSATALHDGRVDSIVYPCQSLASTNYRPFVQGSFPPVLPTEYHAGNSVAIGKLPANNGQILSHPYTRELFHIVPPRPPPSVQYSLDPLTQYWRQVHDTCGDGLRSQVGATRQLENCPDAGVSYERSIPKYTEITNPRLMQSTLQHFGSPHLAGPPSANVPYRGYIFPRSSQPNPNLMDTAWITPTQRIPEISTTQAPPRRLYGYHDAPMHVKRVWPAVSMPMLNLQHQRPILLRHPVQDANHTGLYSLRNDLQGPMAPQCGIDLRLSIHTISEASFHSNPPPPQVMNISQTTVSHPSPASIGSPQIPEKDFNSKLHDFSARARQHSVIVGFPKEEPVNVHQLGLRHQWSLPMDIKVSRVEKGLQSVREGEGSQKEVSVEAESSNSQYQLNSHPPAIEEGLKDGEGPQCSSQIPQPNASQNKPLQTSPFDRPVVCTKPEEILSWRTTRDENTTLVLHSEKSKPASLKPYPLASSKGLLQIPITAKDDGSSTLSSNSGGSGNGKTTVIVSQKRRESLTPLGDGQPRINPPPLVVGPCLKGSITLSDSDKKVLEGKGEWKPWQG